MSVPTIKEQEIYKKQKVTGVILNTTGFLCVYQIHSSHSKYTQVAQLAFSMPKHVQLTLSLL